MSKPVDIVNQSEPAAQDEVMELVHTIAHAYRAQRFRALRDGPHVITPMDGRVLGFFDRHPGATQSDLVQHSGRDKAQLARLIKGLREKGLLLAEADATDRRSVRLSLSEEGRAVQGALKREARRLGKAAIAGLDAEALRQLASGLRHIRSNLEAAG